jgi:hypothetical protein
MNWRNSVGAGLLANALRESTPLYLVKRLRQQAGSYKKSHRVSRVRNADIATTHKKACPKTGFLNNLCR